MARRYHAPQAGSTNVRHADRSSERVLGEAMVLLEDLFHAAVRHGDVRRAAAQVVEVAARATAEARASRARTAAALAARVGRLEAEVRRARGR